MTGKRNSASRQPAFIFTFPPGLRSVGLCRDGRVSGSPGKAARSPGPQRPRSAPWLQRPPRPVPPQDSLQAGPPFSRSPHPLCSVYQDKNAKNMNGYEPLYCLLFQLKILKDQPYRNRDIDIEHRLWTRQGKKRVGRVASSIKIYTLQCVQ